MHAKAIYPLKVNSNSKNLRKKMWLYFSSKLTLELANNNTLEITLITQNISKFLGMGKSKINQPIMCVDCIDKATQKELLMDL